MLRTQWVTRTTCSKRTSRLCPAVGMTMLTGGSSLELRVEVVDAGVLEVALDPRRQPDPLAVGLERPRPGFEGPGLRLFAAAGGRGLEHPPVVEDPRHVDDPPRPLGDPQDQVPVLGALELGVEAADLLDQRAAQDAEVAGVHLGPHPLRRPVGLEERARVVPGLVDLVFVGVDVVDLGVGAERLVDVARARRGGACRRGRAGRRTRPPPSPGRRWRRRRCRRSRSRRQTRIAGRPRARASSSDLAARAARPSRRRRGRAPSRRSAGGGPSRASPEDVRRGFVDRREDREAGGGQPAQPLPLRRCESLRARRPGSFPG